MGNQSVFICDSLANEKDLVGLDFYYKLSRINKRCIAHTDTHLQITSSILMQPGDIVLVI